MDFADVDRDELERLRQLYRPLTDAVRELVEATIRTEVDDDVIREAHAELTDVTATLRDAGLDGPFGTKVTGDGISIAWGNAAVGTRNAIAPPLTIEVDDDGRHHSTVALGAAYEGPPGLVHGGVCALVLDHVLGMAGSADTRRLTGTLTLKYLRGTPLGTVHAEARTVSVDGRKATVRGTLSDADGVTVEAEGLFITPAPQN